MIRLFSLLMTGLLAIGCAARPTPTAAPTLTPTAATEAPDFPRYAIQPQRSIINYLATGALNLQLPGTFGVIGNDVQLVPEGDGYRVKIDVVIDGKSVTAVNDLIRSVLVINLEVDRFPTARFVADSVELIALSDGAIPFTASGTLTLHGQVRSIRMPIRMTVIDGLLTATGETRLDLLDYGVNVPTAIMNSTITFKATIIGTLVNTSSK
jgi:polyisoprenoid-binding protein YceI